LPAATAWLRLRAMKTKTKVKAGQLPDVVDSKSYTDNWRVQR
jgi:hypothetical protein